ncbi:hypothetical protein BJQ97_03206 [Geobacillus sp. TFV-3]|nr:hypothetical protein BJQ97_03206 [Geobacillus sp. TFV-3]
MSYSWGRLIFPIFLSTFMLYMILETAVRRAMDSSTLAEHIKKPLEDRKRRNDSRH